MSTTLPMNIEYDKWKQWFKVVAWCEPGTFKFVYEQECCDTSQTSIFDNKEFDWWVCPWEQVFMTLSSDCHTVVPMTLAQIMALVNTDEKVKVTAADPCPKYLADSFQPGQYIQFSQWTNGICQVLIPQLNLGAVAAALDVHALAGWVPSTASCWTTTAVALNPSNSILPSDIPYQYNVYRNGSNINEAIECSPYYNVHMRKFRWQLWLLSDQTRTINTSQEPVFYLSPTSIPQLNSQWWTQWNVPYTQWWMRHRITGVNGYLQMLTAGDAEITFQVNYEVNKWMHAVRFGVLAVFPNGNIIPIVQAKEWQASAPRYPWANTSWWSLQDRFGNHTTTLIQWYWWASLFQFSMGRTQQFFVGNWSARWHFPQNTIFVPFCRPSTMMTWDTDASSVPGVLSIYWLASWGPGSEALMQWGMYFDVKCIDDDWDRMYWIKHYNL